ncbi:MAG: Ig-like domain-containing protein, partial [Methanosarcinales archaeon]
KNTTLFFNSIISSEICKYYACYKTYSYDISKYSGQNLTLYFEQKSPTWAWSCVVYFNINVTVTVPNQLPNLTVLYPNSRETLSGTITLIASANSSVGIKNVTFQYSNNSGINWTTLGDSPNTTNPYTYEWNTRTVPNGKYYLIKAIATDNYGNTANDTSDSLFEIKNLPNNPPIAKVIYPNGGEVVSGIVTLLVNASDPDGDSISVEFQYSKDRGRTWIPLSNATSYPYAYEWNTMEVENGTKYKIKAIATDNYGGVASDESDFLFTIANFNKTFIGSVLGEEIKPLHYIPYGASMVNITLNSNKELDLQLYNSTNDLIVGWDGVIEKPGTYVYNGMEIEYSGYIGGYEYIKINKTTEFLNLRVYGYEAGDYNIEVVYAPDYALPKIEIYTDQTNYSANETQILGLDIKNPSNAQKVGIKIWLDMPSGNTMTLINATVTLKSNLDYSNADFKNFTLPNIASGTYVWKAQITDLNGTIISRDTAEWVFTSTAKTTLELVRDFMLMNLPV